MAEVRRKVPALAGLDDQAAIALLHRLHYPTMAPEDIAAHLGVTWAPHRAACMRHFKSLYE